MAEPEDSKEDRIGRELSQLLQALDATGRIDLPGSTDALLKSIVEAAAKIFGAAAASILLVNEPEGVLIFKVAYGASDHELVGRRIPLNQGIAGYVAMSGQPIAIADVAQDTRFNRDFASSTGYVPRSILATPLMAGERVLGVMEVLDKISAPSFGMQDMELLGLFARQAALAIHQAQSMDNIGVALLEGLKKLAAAELKQAPSGLLDNLKPGEDGAKQEDLDRLVEVLKEFSEMGGEERQMALKILEAVVAYSQNRRRLSQGTNWK
jgi:GAF domain-containing protein